MVRYYQRDLRMRIEVVQMLSRRVRTSSVGRNVMFVFTIATGERGVEETTTTVSAAGVIDAALEASDRGACRAIRRMVRRFPLTAAAMASARSELTSKRRIETGTSDEFLES